MITDNVIALREMAKAVGTIGDDSQGRRTFAQMLLDAADEIERLRERCVALAAISAKTEAEFEDIIKPNKRGIIEP